MRIVLPLALLAIFASASALTVAECQAACKPDANPTCSIDGVVYTSKCASLCASQDNYEYSPCPTAASCSNCASATAAFRCKEACGRTDDKNVYCGTNGQAYANKCKAACDYGTFDVAFPCNANYLYTTTLCYPKCQLALTCRQQYGNKVSSTVYCGTDAIVYNSLEELTCNNVYDASSRATPAPAFVGTGNRDADLTACYNYVILYLGIVTGSSRPIKPKL